MDGLTFVGAPDAIVFLRRGLTGAKLFRQYYRWGRERPQLYRAYGADGYARRSLGELLLGYGRLAYHAARGLFDALAVVTICVTCRLTLDWLAGVEEGQ